ncbi:hypothetical protein ACFLXU_00745 [Chloroflexota bacterium]
MNNKLSNNNEETRQERREEKLRKKRERIPQHGRNLARVYKEAILKRINKLRGEKQKGQEK